ncbi:hypothetical protein SDC9_33336 [bioreactor metagenome]|uniref:Uncharacterized protein n=1 Tax=bioreactor metagenome TaxID=1076179 RepID=A0A644V7K6_9ZZZZ
MVQEKSLSYMLRQTFLASVVNLTVYVTIS